MEGQESRHRGACFQGPRLPQAWLNPGGNAGGLEEPLCGSGHAAAGVCGDRKTRVSHPCPEAA